MGMSLEEKISTARKRRPFVDLSGKDIAKEFGPNIDDCCFACADLSETDWTGVESALNVDLRCARLDGANLKNVVTRGWNCVGASMHSAILDGAHVYAVLHGAVLSGASMVGVHWHRGGHAASRGIILPQRVPFETWVGGDNFHGGIALLLQQELPGDKDVQRVVDYILAQPTRFHYYEPFPCWPGLVKMCHNELPHVIDKLQGVFSNFPNMRLAARWRLAEQQLKKTP